MKYRVFGYFGPGPSKEYASPQAMRLMVNVHGATRINIDTTRRAFEILTDVQEMKVRGTFETLDEITGAINATKRLRGVPIYVDDAPYNVDPIGSAPITVYLTHKERERVEARLRAENCTLGAWITRMLDR